LCEFSIKELDAMIDFVKRHVIKIAIGTIVLIIVVVVAGQRIRHKPVEVPLTESSEHIAESVESQPQQSPQPQEPPEPTTTSGETQRSVNVSQNVPAHDTTAASSPSQEKEKPSKKIADLQRKSAELERRITQLHTEEQMKMGWRKEQLELLENHTQQIENLGNTLQQVFRTPTQIRIMAADLESQAKGIRSQIQSLSQLARTSDIEREIWNDKRSVLEQQATDIETISLDLQQTQGNPSRVRVLAIRYVGRGKELRTALENLKGQASSPNSELSDAEKQLASVRKNIEELQ
jgi:chromosome segregation ATPase